MSVITKENNAKMSNNRTPTVTNLGVSAGNFVSHNSGSNSKIDRFFSRPLAEENFAEEVNEEVELIDEEEEEEREAVPFVEKEESSSETATLSEISPDQVSEENSRISFPEPERNEATVDFIENIDDQEKEKPSETSEKPNSKKKLGFFASRSVKKTETKALEPETGKKESFPFFCVHEIFPDLDQVDSETLTLLPLEIQRMVRQEMELKKGSKSPSGDFINCDTCGKVLLREEVAEHRDYHVAMELQKEMSLEASTSSAIPSSTGRVVPSKPTKRPYRSKAKANATNSKRSRTIESFFTKNE